MAKRMLIDALHPEETRVVIADENQVYDFDFVSASKKQLKGNIYLAKITRVEPSLQAAFVEYGGGKQGFLPFAEIHADYYQIPVSDRKRLMEESSREDTSDESPEAEPLNDGEQTTTEQENPAGDDITAAAMAAGDEPFAPGLEDASEHDQAHPAYLVQGAIELSASEELEGAEAPVAETAEEHNDSAIHESAPQEARSSEEVETLASEEDDYRAPKKNHFSKRYKIQEVIRRGQIVLVQVIKEERGNKGVSLTTYLSLAGRYCVLMPNSPKDGGISRKIASGEDRKRLKAISTELRLSDGMSVIIRTAGMDRTRAEIKRDYDYLVKVWNGIRETTLQSNAPALIYEESDIIKRAIRDQYSGDIDELIIEGDQGFKVAKEFMKLLLPSHTPKIKHYKEPTPLFYAYNVEEQLLSMHDPVVKLRSGGYIVINPTEALISVDVNSGRATGERNIEETATKTNLEAAAEVARQLRLRDLAGLIVIDFIDMMESRNRRNVEKTLKDSLKADRAKIQLGRISPFGLLEMSRQRLRSSISETNMVQCPHCTGRGFVRSNESMSIQAIRSIEKEASAGVWSSLRLIAPQSVALHLLNSKRDALRAIEQRYGLSVQVLINPDTTVVDFSLDKTRRGQNERNETSEYRRPKRNERPERSDRNERPERNERSRPAPVAANDDAGNDNADPSEDKAEGARDDSSNGEARRRGRRNRRGGRNRDRGERQAFNAEGQENAAPVSEAEPGETPDSTPTDADSTTSRPPRQRGGRGRRPWRDRSAEGNDNPPPEPTSWSSGAGESNVIPAFAAEPITTTIAPPLPPRRAAAEAPAPVESTPRDPNAPAKKGWWKKMIELDE